MSIANQHEITMQLQFSGKKHAKILTKIEDRYKQSHRRMSSRYAYFTDQENRYRAFRPASEADAKRDILRDEGKPQFTTFEVPMSYSILLTMHSHMSGIFLGRSPIFQFSGRDGQAEDNKLAVEALMQPQVL